MTTIIASVIALFVGIAIGWFIMRLAMKYRAQNIIKEAEAEAEVIKKDKILQAKEKFLRSEDGRKQVKTTGNRYFAQTGRNTTQREITPKPAKQHRSTKRIDRKENGRIGQDQKTANRTT